MSANITTKTLNMARADFAASATIAMNDEDMRLWNLANDTPDANQNPVYIKDTTGFARATAVAEGSPNPLQRPLALPQLTMTQIRHGIKYIHSVEAKIFDPYGKIPAMGSAAGKAIAEAKLWAAANVFLNNAFDATNYPTATGKAFFDDDHPLGDYTHDNLLDATALSEAAVEAGIVALRGQKNPRNEPMPYNKALYLLHSPTDSATAEKIAETSSKLGSTDNDANIVRKYIEPLMVSHATSTTAWALVPRNKSDHYVQKVVAVEMANGSDIDEDDNAKFAMWTIFAMGVRNGLNCVGNAGA